jgi:hypothetical protein
MTISFLASWTPPWRNYFQLTTLSGGVASASRQQFKATDWLTLNGGIRLTHSGHQRKCRRSAKGFDSWPRLIALPAVYGRYYQPPPLHGLRAAPGICRNQWIWILPLYGERDEQWFGLTYLARLVGPAHFRTGASNSLIMMRWATRNIFAFTIGAHIRGYEATIRSPQTASRAIESGHPTRRSRARSVMRSD